MAKKATFNWERVDGNALSLIAEAGRVMRVNGDRDKIEEMRKEAMSGNYDHVIYTVCRYTEKYENEDGGNSEEDSE